MDKIKWKKDSTVQIDRIFSTTNKYLFIIDSSLDTVELTVFIHKNKEKLFLGGRNFINRTDAIEYVNDIHKLEEDSIRKRLIIFS